MAIGFPRRFILVAALSAADTLAQQPANPDLSQASLEDLMNIQVTSVSKKEQQLSKTGAAIFVITQEDIRRSGTTNIPDVLRLAPGVDVARIDANRWAVSIRGFNDQHANKVLVLVDGRSVYSPSFSGVYWDEVDVPLEDIERIEVIRGPGGTVWGANAVNGVINIITANAAASKGGLLSAGGGSQDHADGLVQYGGQIGQDGSYRVFGRYFDVGNSVFPGGHEATDGWMAGHAGFRSDWKLSPRDTLTVQGDFLRTAESQSTTTLFFNALSRGAVTFQDPVRVIAGNVLARWNHTLANGSEMSLQVYEDYSKRLDQGFLSSENTVDLDFQDHLALGSRNDVVWGVGTRVIESAYGPGYAIAVLPNRRTDSLFSGFVQDQLKLTDSLSLTVGTKLEHNDFTGFEYEPSAQLVWTLSANQIVWGSASRAIREPSPSDVGVQDEETVPAGGTLIIIRPTGNPNIKAEGFRDLEVGYRALANKRLSMAVTSFAGFYGNLLTAASQAPYLATQEAVPYLIFPQLLMNGPSARTYGAELLANLNLTGRWRISPSYSYFHINVNGNSTLNTPPGTSPDHQFQVKSLLDLPHHLEWDSTLGYVSKLAVGNIPAYARVDSRLGWRVGEFVEFSLVGQNLLTPRHAEFGNGFSTTNYTLVERSVFVKMTWRF
jgi:iron complex outermembrane receptor protein